MTNNSISSRQASELLGVHESSVKRWCNSGELACWLTPGGHRRIAISELVAFARERGIETPIAAFGTEAERVWIGVVSGRDGDFAILSRLFFEWLERERTDLIERLLLFLLDEEFTPGQVFDHVLAAAMKRVGIGYERRQISIGDEHRMTQSARDALIGVKRLLEVGDNDLNGRPTAVVGCARSETHEMGALAIRLILRQQGWKVLYLGADVPTEEFHAQLEKHRANLVCVSMSPVKGVATAVEIAELLDLLGRNGHPFRLAIGGEALDDRALPTSGGALVEVHLFHTAWAFETWVRELETEPVEPTKAP